MVEFVAENEIAEGASIHAVEIQPVPRWGGGPAFSACIDWASIIVENVATLRTISATTKREGVGTFGAEGFITVVHECRADGAPRG